MRTHVQLESIYNLCLDHCSDSESDSELETELELVIESLLLPDSNSASSNWEWRCGSVLVSLEGAGLSSEDSRSTDCIDLMDM